MRPKPLAWKAIDWRRFVIAGLAYYAAIWLGRWALVSRVSLHHIPVAISPFWPASGVMLGLMLLWGAETVAPVALLVGLLASHGFASWPVGLAISAFNVLGVSVAVHLMRRSGWQEGPRRLTDLILLLIYGCGLNPLLSGVPGVWLLQATHYLSANYPTHLWTWWQGNCAGVLFIAPLILSVRLRPMHWLRWLELSLMLAGALRLNWIIFRAQFFFHHTPLPLPLIPFVFWAALRFGPGGVSSVGLISIGELLAQLHSQVLSPDYIYRFNYYQLNILITIVAALFLAAVLGERDANRAQLLKFLRQYRMLFDRNLAAIIRTTPDGKLLASNPAFETLLGYRSEEILGLTMPELYVRPAEREGLIARLNRDGLVSNFLVELRHKSGSSRWALENANWITEPGEPTCLEAIMVDITDLHHAEQALRESEERFRALAEYSSDAIALLSPTGQILYAGPSTRRVTGYADEEFVGRNGFDFVHPDDKTDSQARLAWVLAESGRRQSNTIRMRFADGDWHWVECHTVNLLHLPSVEALVVNYRDITERRGLEEQVRQVQKMEAIGRLAGGIAHDFNNLLTVISGQSELLLRRLPEASPESEKVTHIIAAGKRAAGLTGQLLAFSRRQSFQIRNLDPSSLLREIAGLLRRLIGENIEFLVELDPGLPHLRADPSQIEQIVMNLVLNARDALPQGGQIRLRARSVTPPEGVDSGTWLELSISDNGIGMDAAVQARLFEPFFTTKQVGQGTGLGLSTVYGIVQQLSGKLEVESAPGAGSTFTILLPGLAESETVSPPVHPRSAAPAGSEHSVSATRTILWVEDQPEVLALILDSLQEAGYRVLAAGTPAAALRLAESPDTQIDLLLSDLQMPGMDGRELARRLRRRRPGLPVLLVSGFDPPAAPADDPDDSFGFLQKPFSPAGLLRAIQAVLPQGRAAGQP